MPKNADWLPTGRNEQLAMAKNWSAVLARKAADWDISPQEVQTFNAKTAGAEEALAASQSAERSVSAAALVRTRFKDMAVCMRVMKQRRFYKPKLTDADFATLGLKPKKTFLSLIPVPTDIAHGSVELSIRYELVVVSEIIVGAHSDTRANHGVRIFYGVETGNPEAQSALTGKHYYLGAAPHSPDQLTENEFASTKRHAITFPTEDSGKTAWFALRVENSKGKRGPWGEMFSAVIP